MKQRDNPDLRTIRETVLSLKVENLKALLALMQRRAAGNKAELAKPLAAFLTDEKEVRRLYESLDDREKTVVQEATHDPLGRLNRSRFEAKYGSLPAFAMPGRTRYLSLPTRLELFFLHKEVLPTDLRTMLLTFVPAPPPFTIATLKELPTSIQRKRGFDWGPASKREPEEADLRVRPMEREALVNLKSILHLVESGQIKVGETTRVASQATLKFVAAGLAEGDFYNDNESAESSWEPDFDRNTMAFAWPLAGDSGAKLGLTPAGRKALSASVQETIRHI